MKKILIAVVVLAAAGGGWWWFAKNGGPAPSPRTEVKRAKAQQGDITVTVNATGEITPIRQIELKSKASGLVVRFRKLEGDAVEAGELIAELDKTTNTRDVERSRADLQSAEARLSLARMEYAKALAQAESEVAAATEDVRQKSAELDRLQRLDGGVVSETDLGNARLAKRLAEEKLKQAEAALALVRDRKDADLKLADSDVAKARTSLQDAEDRLRDTEVRAPIQGILLKKLVEEGQIVSSGISSTSGGTAIAVVADVTSLVVVANVDETDIGKVAAGRSAVITVESLPEKRFLGKVELIPPRGDVDSNIIVFKVRIGLDGRHFGDLRIGMTATVNILVAQEKQVVLVPSEAVKSEKGRKYVLVPDGEAQKRVDVKVGLEDGARTQVVDGLKAGDDVLIVYTIQDPRMPAARPMRMR
jgi:HlyD family secretion protein